MGTKNNPASNDCYAKAEGDEPMFVLLARDPAAPLLVLLWIEERRHAIRKGQLPLSDNEDAKLQEAKKCAEDMYAWYKANR